MKYFLMCSLIFLLPRGGAAFGPPGLVEPGVYRSNAAGLPLQRLGGESVAGGNEPPFPDKGWILEVKPGTEGLEEYLFLDGELQISRKQADEDSPDSEFVMGESQSGAPPMPREEPGIGSLFYNLEGKLLLLSGDGESFYVTDPVLGIAKGENSSPGAAGIPSQASFFLSRQGEEFASYLEGDAVVRSELVRYLPGSGWREETLQDPTGEIIRVYDRENRLRSLRSRGSRGFSLIEYDYPSGGIMTVRYRSGRIIEESRVWKDGEGNLERIVVKRGDRTIAEILRKDIMYLHMVFDPSGTFKEEVSMEETIEESELKILEERYPSLAAEGILW